MKLKLKEEYINMTIYVAFENKNILGKFIDKDLYPYLQKRAPELFEFVCEKCENVSCKCKKIKEADVKPDQKSNTSGNSNTIGK